MAREKIQQREVLMNKVKFTLLAAGFALALAFTFSCSSGDEGGGGYKSCKEFIEIMKWCEDQNDNEEDPECVIEKACGGNDEATCGAHYQSECPEMFGDQD
jgi:hypothetical protein